MDAVRFGGVEGNRGHLTLEIPPGLVGNPLERQHRSDEFRESISTKRNVTEPANSRPPTARAASLALEQRQNLIGRDAAGGECVTPDSLERIALVTTPLPLSDVVVVRQGDGVPGGAASSSSAAHAEAFGRATASGQAALDTTGTDEILNGGDERSASGSRGEARGNVCAKSNSVEGSENSTVNREARQTLPRSSSFPPTTAITISPPPGLARPPPGPGDFTRASQKRLVAAFENLSLRDNIKPIADGTECSIASRSAGARLHAGRTGRSSSWQRENARKFVSIDIVDGAREGGGTTASRTSRASGKGESAVNRKRTARVGADRKISLRGDRRVGYSTTERGGGVDRVGVRGYEKRCAEHQDDQDDRYDRSDAGSSDDTYGGGSRDASEVIGKFRARIAELELTEQLLRLELEGARADLAEGARRASSEAKYAAERSKERESALQARMQSRLRTVEAEATAAQRRTAELKRSTAAEAFARERSSVEYLRRRLKEMEAGLEAKVTRRLAQHRQQRTTEYCRRCRKKSTHSGGGFVDADVVSGAHRRPPAGWRDPGDSSSNTRHGGASAAETALSKAKVCEELRECRTKLVVATADVSRLRAQAAMTTTTTPPIEGGLQRRGRPDERLRAAGSECQKGSAAIKEEKDSCSICRGKRNRIRTDGAILSDRRQRRKYREKLEQRLAESENARIEAETESGRLQAFVDEMRSLGYPAVFAGRGRERVNE